MRKTLTALAVLLTVLVAPTAAHATETVKSCSVTNVTLTGGTVKFTNNCTQKLALVVYTAPSARFNAKTADQQKLSSYKTWDAAAAGDYTGSVTLPDCYYQVDFVYGTYKQTLSEHNLYGDKLIASDNGGTKACVPTTTTTSTTVTTPTPTVNRLEQNYGDDTIAQPVTTVPAQVSAEIVTTQPAAKQLATTGPHHIKGLIELGLGLLILGTMFMLGGYTIPIKIKGQ